MSIPLSRQIQCIERELELRRIRLAGVTFPSINLDVSCAAEKQVRELEAVLETLRSNKIAPESDPFEESYKELEKNGIADGTAKNYWTAKAIWDAAIKRAKEEK